MGTLKLPLYTMPGPTAGPRRAAQSRTGLEARAPSVVARVPGPGCPPPRVGCRRELGPPGGRSRPGLREPGCLCAGRPRGRGAKAPRLACEAAGVIRISDDSSTESDAGLDSDFHSSPESVLDDDVLILDAVGLPADDRGEARSPAFGTLQTGGDGLGELAGPSPEAAGSRQQSGLRDTLPCASRPLLCVLPLTLWPCRAPVPPAAGPTWPRHPGACGAVKAGPAGQGADAGPGAARQHSG